MDRPATALRSQERRLLERLQRVRKVTPQLAAVGCLTLLQNLRCVRLVLWDESRRRLIFFREMRILTSEANGSALAAANQASS
jgi:hypothetical protein